MSSELQNVEFEWLLQSPPGTIIDIGCGNGRHVCALAKAGREVIALDTSEEALKNTQEKAQKLGVEISVVQQDVAEYLHSTNDTYAGVLAKYIFHFFPSKDRAHFIRLLKERTQENGIHVISGFTANGDLSKGFVFFTAEELRELYADWTIIALEEQLVPTRMRSESGAVLSQQAVTIIAKKNT